MNIGTLCAVILCIIMVSFIGYWIAAMGTISDREYPCVCLFLLEGPLAWLMLITRSNLFADGRNLTDIESGLFVLVLIFSAAMGICVGKFLLEALADNNPKIDKAINVHMGAGLLVILFLIAFAVLLIVCYILLAL